MGGYYVCPSQRHVEIKAAKTDRLSMSLFPVSSSHPFVQHRALYTEEIQDQPDIRVRRRLVTT